MASAAAFCGIVGRFVRNSPFRRFAHGLPALIEGTIVTELN
jgi:hypothetical protein